MQNRHSRGNYSENAFDFLRVTAASAVLFSHSYALYGLAEPKPIGSFTLGQVAVFVFFAISGYLVGQSWDRDPNPKRFTVRRALRILPGLFVAITFTTLVVGPIATTLPVMEYLLSPGTYKYFISNASLVVGVYELPGVFKNNPYPHSINGSLWTLRYEVLMYAWLAIIGLLMSHKRVKAVCLLSLIFFSSSWYICRVFGIDQYKLPLPLIWQLGIGFDGIQIAMLGAFFFCGSCLYLFRTNVPLSVWIAIPLCIACALIDSQVYAVVLAWITIPYTAIVFAQMAPPLFRRLKGVDYSYGIYIYAFPIQQTVSLFGFHNGLGWFAALVISALTTLALAATSWHFVEHPALTWKARLLPREKSGPM